jgi:CspA family cold shock protein
MNKGTIARLTDKGFGFITQEGADKDLFFHANEVLEARYDDLQEGDTVTFEIGEGPKGPHAIEIELAEEGAAPAPATDEADAPAEDEA